MGKKRGKKQSENKSEEGSGQSSETLSSEPGSAVQSPQRPQPIQQAGSVQQCLPNPHVMQQQPGPQVTQQHPTCPPSIQQPNVVSQGINQPLTAPLTQHCPPGPMPPRHRLALAQALLMRPSVPQHVQQNLSGPRPVQQNPTASQHSQQRPWGPQSQSAQQTLTGPSPVQQLPDAQPMQQRPWGPPKIPSAQPVQHHALGPQLARQRYPGPQEVRKPAESTQATQQRSPSRPIAQGGSLRPPSREIAGGTGTLGTAISVSANHFAVSLKKAIVYHYDVDIKPEPSKALFRKVIGRFLSSEPRLQGILPVFDSKKNIYTARPIPGLDSKIEIKYEFEEVDRETHKTLEFTIYLQPTGELEIDLGILASYCKGGASTDIPLRPIQALDIAMKYGAAQKNTKVMLGSCLLSKPTGRAEDLGGGVEVWFGHFQSLRLGWQPFLNVDATQRAFLKSGKVHEVMAEMFRARLGDSLGDRDYHEFSKKIATLKVSYNRGQYIATCGCNGLSKMPANREEFQCGDRTVTVQQYFEEKLKARLQFPNLPCVWVGSREKKNYVPMELCTFPSGQEYRRKLTDMQTSAMIKVAATPADIRKKKILDSVRDMQFATDSYSQNFGISVDSQMAKITGRVLPAPKLVYGERETCSIVPREGVWNMRNFKFIEAKSMNHFGLINITRCGDREIDYFISALTKAGQDMGMGIGKPLFVRPCSSRDLENTMKMAKQKFPQLQIIFVIINRKGDPAYEVVKRVGDLDLRITTQCIQQKNVTGRNGPDPSTMANICLKLNAKLGGVNNLISRDFRPKVLLQEQVIIMGADVTHPGADQQDSGKPSIAAVVGSVDPRASQYCCEIRIQKSKQEYIEDMENMVYNLLRKFNKVTGSTSTGKPQRIIFYRDGVSEGQFAKVLQWELSAIRKACMKLENGYQPPVTFIVVQKRHHTRLFPEDRKDECGRGRNVPPGTIVDTEIVHPVEQDFFLVSHQGIQGTSRPTHYHVLWDDAKMQANEVQILTYYMCYLFTRCTRSVSYPAPCYYSHLVAYRGRQYYDNLVGYQQAISSKDLQTHIDSTRDLSFMFFV